MKNFKDIHQFLTRYFLQEESEQERKALYQWFDEQQVDGEQDVEEQVLTVKKQLFNQLSKQDDKKIVSRVNWRWGTAAAAILIAMISFYFYQNSKPQMASTALLALQVPGKEAAFITLEGGEKINLNALKVDQPVRVGEVFIKKDKLGRINYLNAQTGQVVAQQNQLTTPKGRIADLTLADGTEVHLNAGSSLTYPNVFAAGDRIVELDGEAYFHVKRTENKSKFIVKAKEQQTIVLGTRFNVDAYAGESKLKTTLEDGSVKMRFANNNKEVLLKPGQQAVWNQKSYQVAAVDLAEVLAWKEGQFYFNGNNTEEVLKQIGRWYGIKITYQPTEGSNDYVGKIPKNISLDKLIELLNFAELKTKALVDRNQKIQLFIN